MWNTHTMKLYSSISKNKFYMKTDEEIVKLS